MKKIVSTAILIITTYGLFAQLNSSNLNVPASSQPVPNATTTEKAATPQPQNIAPAPNPVPPIYPGAEVQAAETQRQLVYPPTTPNSTQPVQKEPLSPIESTNNLQPNRSQREENSRKPPAVAAFNNTANANNEIRKVPVKVDVPVKTTSNKSAYIKPIVTAKKQSVETKVLNKKTVKIKKATPKN